jgi:hypothetical protein
MESSSKPIQIRRKLDAVSVEEVKARIVLVCGSMGSKRTWSATSSSQNDLLDKLIVSQTYPEANRGARLVY